MAVKHSHDPEIHQAHADTDVKFFEVCSDTGGIFLEAPFQMVNSLNPVRIQAVNL